MTAPKLKMRSVGETDLLVQLGVPDFIRLVGGILIMAAPKLKMRLGDLLVHEHIITNEQLMQALNSQKNNGSEIR